MPDLHRGNGAPGFAGAAALPSARVMPQHDVALMQKVQSRASARIMRATSTRELLQARNAQSDRYEKAQTMVHVRNVQGRKVRRSNVQQPMAILVEYY